MLKTRVVFVSLAVLSASMPGCVVASDVDGSSEVEEEVAVDEVTEEISVARIKVGLQVADKGHDKVGTARYTGWVDGTATANASSPWAVDTNGYDPDSVRVHLQTESADVRAGLDVRVCMEASDDNATSQFGAKRCTPWASESGGWSATATDANGYDPDAYRISVETRMLAAGCMTRDFRIGVRGFDGGATSHGGQAQYSPWASQGGGWSGWASDDNNYDPDGFALHLDVMP